MAPGRFRGNYLPPDAGGGMKAAMMTIAGWKAALNDIGLFKKCYLLNALFITFYFYSWGRISTITSVTLTLWGAYLMLQGFLHRQFDLRQKGLWMLAVFFGALCMSSLVNLPNGWMKNAQAIALAAVTFLVVYYLEPQDSAKEKKDFEGCLKIIMVYSCVMSSISLLMYFSNICIINYPDRYAGIYLNPILSGLVANGGLFCTVYFLWGWKRRPWRIKALCIAQMVVQTVVMIIGNSRSAYCCFVAFFVIYIGMQIANGKLLQNPVWNRVLKVAIALVTVAVIVVGSNFLAEGINRGVYELNKAIFSLRYPDYDPDSPNYGDTDNWFTPHPLERSNEEASSNIRLNMIATGWDTFKENPILGTSPGDLIRSVLDTAERQGQPEDSLQGIEGGRVHNAYLDVLVSMGLLGLIPMILFAVYSVIKAYQCTFACRKDRPAYDHNTFVVSVIGAMATFFFMESTMLFTMSFAEAFFWLSLGHLAQRAKFQGKRISPQVDKNGVCHL